MSDLWFGELGAFASENKENNVINPLLFFLSEDRELSRVVAEVENKQISMNDLQKRKQEIAALIETTVFSTEQLEGLNLESDMLEQALQGDEYIDIEVASSTDLSF